MNKYYDERADEYDDIYLGKGPASVKDPDAYQNDVRHVKSILEKQKCSGNVIDVPAGTAFWMDSYYKNAESILLIDQSSNMLEQSKSRAASFGVEDKCTFIKADILTLDELPLSADYVICGFLISHFNDVKEKHFFNFLKKSISVSGQIFVIDSTWNDERADKLKEGLQSRKLNDGTEFEIYKKYFDKDEINSLGKKHGFKTNVKYIGKTMFLACLHL